MKSVVREFANAGTAWCIETTAPPRQTKTAVAPASTTPAATNDELRRAFDDLLIAMAPAERAAVSRDLRGRATGRPQKRVLDDSPEARRRAAAAFGLSTI